MSTEFTAGRADGTIYALGAPVYREADWSGVLPLPPNSKSPPPTGFTGYDGAWPSDDQIDQWMSEKPAPSNLGLRIPHGLLVLDVDAYDGKTGGATLTEAERRWGPLPPTYRSTARHDDPVSGQRVYRVPMGLLFRPGVSFPELDLSHVDTIQPHLRLMAVWPSIHPKTGQVYRWYDPDGNMLSADVVPRVDDFPELPDDWRDGLAKDALRDEVFDGSAPNRSRALRERINQELFRKLIDEAGDGAPGRAVEARLERAVSDLMSGVASRFDTARDHVAGLTRLRALGHKGVASALCQLRLAYVLEVGDTRPAEVAEGEFLRFTKGAAMLIAATPQLGEQQDAGQLADADEASVPDVPSWAPLDVSALIAGKDVGSTPTLLRRTDGVCLLYPGLTHSIHGESESGKSLIVQAECAQLVNDGHRVLYIDFESDPRSVLDRLRQLGAGEQAVAEYFHYLCPEVSPHSSENERAEWESLLENQYTLAVLDGVTEALTVFGRGSMDNDDLAAWNRQVPRTIADRTGAAVVLIDHVVKDKTSRNRFAIGGQAKMAALTGAAYIVEVDQPLGQGMCGAVGLRIAKDRPGRVRQLCGQFRKGDRTQTAARVVIDSTGDMTAVTIEPWNGQTARESSSAKFRPTALMERVSRVIEGSAEPMTKTAAAKGAGGKKEWALLAFDILLQEGYLAAQGERAGHPLYVSVNPYSERADQLAQHHQGGEPRPALKSV